MALRGRAPNFGDVTCISVSATQFGTKRLLPIAMAHGQWPMYSSAVAGDRNAENAYRMLRR